MACSMLMVPTRLEPVAAGDGSAAAAGGGVALGAAGSVASDLPVCARLKADRANTAARRKHVNLLFMGLILNSLETFREILLRIFINRPLDETPVLDLAIASHKADRLTASHVERTKATTTPPISFSGREAHI